jgi:large subunit ribosomal protein L7A
MFDELKGAQNRVVGLKQLLKELKNDGVVCIYIAEDADMHIKGKIRKAVGDRDIAFQNVESMDVLGGICE